jgi:hypothetical protein
MISSKFISIFSGVFISIFLVENYLLDLLVFAKEAALSSNSVPITVFGAWSR